MHRHLRLDQPTRSLVCTCVLASLSAIGCSQLAPSNGPAGASGSGRRPNIVFIFTDDHASHAISAYGSKINTTPNLDRLASQGMLFRNAFCTNSICAPSRAVILTGKHSHLNGVIDNRARFDGAQQTFPKLLQNAGYQTAMIGKWHLKSEPTGFDYWQVLPGQGHYYNPDFKTPDGPVKTTGYVTDIITDLTLDWLKTGRDPDKPFMVMYQHKAPHRQWAPGPNHLTMYDDVTLPEPATLFDDYANRTSAAKQQEMTIAEHMLLGMDLKVRPDPEDEREYKNWQGHYNRLTDEQRQAWDAAYEPKNEAFRQAKLTGKDLVRWKYQRYVKDYLRCIASVDDNVGRLLDYLDETGLANDTIVIYSSDQGFYLGDHGWYDKRWMYEESLRMPLIVQWPGVTRPGSENSDLVQNLDFAQTFLELTGVEQPADMQGRSLVPLLKGKTPKDWRESIYYHYWEFPAVHMVNRHYGVRTDRYKLIHYYKIDEWELFDLRNDPDELRSVYDDPANAGLVKRLKAELKRLQTQYGETDPTGSRAAADRRRLRRQAKKVPLEKVFHVESPEGEANRNLDPTGKPFTVGAWCTPATPNGVLLAHGGNSFGYSLYLKDGFLRFGARSSGQLREVVADDKLPLDRPVHVAGAIDADAKLRLFIDGSLVAQADGHFVASKPAEGLDIGTDGGSFVGEYGTSIPFQGELRDIRIYWGVVDPQSLERWAIAAK